MPPLKYQDHNISLPDAAAHTRRHRQTVGGKPANGDNAGAFHADQVLTILGQSGCVALRIYHGRNAEGLRSMVLVGVDKDGNDMTKGQICELCFPCPPFCTGGDTTLLTG